MNYIGSKLRLSSFIYKTITQIAGEDLSSYTFCDLFAGTGAVSKLFKDKVKKVISNDREYYSYVLNRANFSKHLLPDYNCLIEELNRLQGIPGFIFNEYSENGKAGRLYFSEENGKKIDAVCLKIEEWKNARIISQEIYFLLLASLIKSADKVANTASVYSAYLKQLKITAQKEIVIHPIDSILPGNTEYEVYNEDSNLLIKTIEGDILYLDPPYNSREYGANYHLLNTIALYDNSFVPKGKTGLRKYSTSQYCRKREAAKAFDELISEARFKYIFLSYNNEGLIAAGDIRKIMEKYGNYGMFTTSYSKFKSQKRETEIKSTTEFIHVLSPF